MTKTVRLELLTRRDCGLCDEMKQALERAVRAQASPGMFAIDEVDVDMREDLVGRYGEEVPVLFIDGVEAFRHRADYEPLRERLTVEANR